MTTNWSIRVLAVALHIAEGILPGHPRSRVTGSGRSMRVDGRDFRVKRVVLHPEWTGRGRTTSP